MFQTIVATIASDPASSMRSRRIEIYKRVLDGTLYDGLDYEFHDERNGAGEYIPLRNRRPSVRYGLCRMVVEDSIALLFGDSHYPAIESGDMQTDGAIASLMRDARFKEVFIDAAIRGSVGSVALLMKVLDGRVFVSVLDTQYLIPEWMPEAPDTLLRVTELYKVRGAELLAKGYGALDAGQIYWFRREWDADAETWFLPVPAVVGEAAPADADVAVDAQRSLAHGLGFVPIVWIRNLPGGDGIDGACTFRAAIETSIEIDYQLSQVGRGLKYSSDPTLLIKEPASSDREIVKGAGNALIVSEKGDAKLLEIGGTAAEAVIAYVRLLRELALETLHGNRASADRLSAPQSGRALELMNQGLVWLADNLRISYGECGVLPLVRMIARASQRYPLRINGGRTRLDPERPFTLRWPHWYPDSADDRLKAAQAIAAIRRAGAEEARVTEISGDIQTLEQDGE